MTINEQLHNSAFHKGHEAACPVCNPVKRCIVCGKVDDTLLYDNEACDNCWQRRPGTKAQQQETGDKKWFGESL